MQLLFYNKVVFTRKYVPPFIEGQSSKNISISIEGGSIGVPSLTDSKYLLTSTLLNRYWLMSLRTYFP